MSTSGFQAMPGWYRPDDIPKQENQSTYGPDSRHSSPHSTQGDNQARNGEPSRPRQKYWPPRQCRICLETVQPTYHPPFTNLPGILQFASSVTYESEEGRLIRPCKCKGSSKYVHEGCLQSWRHADPAYGRRNYWQCPTCSFRYRLARLGWGHVVSSPVMQVILTMLILIVAVFVLGFVADPIINMYLDPWSYLTPFSSSQPQLLNQEEDKPTWTEHFLKGFTSVGVIGFLKVFLSSPISWFRTSGGNRGRTARDRYEQISWFIILIGVFTFLVAVFKGVRIWSRRTLEKAGERVMDVQGDDDGEEEGG